MPGLENRIKLDRRKGDLYCLQRNVTITFLSQLEYHFYPSDFSQTSTSLSHQLVSGFQQMPADCCAPPGEAGVRQSVAASC